MKRNTVPRTRRHVWIDDADWEELTLHFGDTLGPSGAIRAMIKAMLAKIRVKAELKGKPLPSLTSEELNVHHNEPPSRD